MKLKGWAGYPVYKAKMTSPVSLDEIIKKLKEGNSIARGNGRSYGDSSISITNTISMKNFNKVITFDNENGILVAESGILLSDIINTFLPDGWFPYVTPGSKYVTLGGMVAADVHGKNHHKEGSFGKYISWIEIIDNKGSIKRCSNLNHNELFQWTIGGMGLTGIITKVAIKLRKVETSWIKQKTIFAKNLDDVMEIFENNMNYTYSVAWIDCLKKDLNMRRSLIFLGEHAILSDLNQKKKKLPLRFSKKNYKLSIPFFFPSWIINRWLIKLFNSFYYWKERFKNSTRLVSWDNFFYPLDSFKGWNKIYGKNGFIQFQCVIPIKQSREGIQNLLDEISKSEIGSFLSVLKRFGKQKGNFSFPMEGYTLALDFPNNKKTLELVSRLDEITLRFNGRFYLAKDSRMSAETFIKSDFRIKNFLSFRQKENLMKSFNSVQSNRLGL